MRPKLVDIAEKTGYAVSTVSHVLNNHKSCYAAEKARNEILSAAREMGYKPNYFAQALRGRKTSTIGVAAHLFASDTQVAQLRAVLRKLLASGYKAFFGDIGDHNEMQEATVEEFLRMQVEGIILAYETSHEPSLPALVRQVPTVVVSPWLVPGFPCLVIDRAASSEKMTERLISLGHRQIAFLSRKSRSNLSKIEGYTRAMAAAGLQRSGAVWEIPEGAGAARQFVRDHADLFKTLTAVETNNDELAIELIFGLQEIGIDVPGDCSVVGHGDIEVSQTITPALATLRQPREEVGSNAVEMLLEHIAGREVENRYLVPQIVERESMGPCRDKF